jgi:hypothetical protein
MDDDEVEMSGTSDEVESESNDELDENVDGDVSSSEDVDRTTGKYFQIVKDSIWDSAKKIDLFDVTTKIMRLFDSLQSGSWQTATYISHGLSSCLSTLYIDGIEVGDHGIECILKGVKINPILSSAHFKNVKISDNGMKLVGKLLNTCNSLVSLTITKNKITPCGATHLGQSLAKNTSLTHLCLSKCSLGSDGLSILAGFLAFNKFLPISTLDLSENDLGDDGFHHVGKILSVNKSICTLKVKRNNIGPVGASNLGKVLKCHYFFFKCS